MTALLERSLKQFATISVTQFITLLVIELIVTTLILVIFSKYFKKNIKTMDVAAIFSLIVYINIIMQLTLLGRKDGSRIGVELELFQYWGKGRFSMQMLMYAFLNVLLFVPYGFILSWLSGFRRQRTTIRVVLTSMLCLATSLLIEVIQYVTGRGYYELEDLFCNTVGGIIGSVVFIAVNKVVTTFTEGGKCDEQ